MPIILDQPSPTAGFTFKLGTLDLSSYLRVNPDDPEKLDPYSKSFLEPAFTESPFADGQPLISLTVQNREQTWGLFLSDPTKLKDQLHALIQSINNAASQRPLMVEWRDAGASTSTFFDVQFCRFEPDFNFRRSVHGIGAGALHVWTSGYGHTGTTRLTATAAGTGVLLTVPIASLAGDAPALLDVTVNAGAIVPSLGRIVAVAPLTQPSYAALIPAASLINLQTGASLTGASGADGSQYLALPVSPTAAASGIACRIPLANPTIAGGDNRILAMVRSGLSGGVGINAVDPYGNSMGATAVASMSESFGLVDLGVCRLPTVGYPTRPLISILAGGLYASGADAPMVLASPGGLQLNEVICLPDRNLTLFLENHTTASVVSKESFLAVAPLAGQNDDLGNPWKEGANNRASNAILLGGGGLAALFTTVGGVIGAATTGSVDSVQLPGIRTDTMLIQAKAFGRCPTLGEVKLMKEAGSGFIVEGRLSYASSFLTLYASGGALASVAVGSVINNWLKISMQLKGAAGVANISRDDGGAILAAGASSAYASIGVSMAGRSGAGEPGFAIVQGASGFDPVLSAWEVDTIPSSNLLPYDAYRVDGVNADAYRVSSAGVFGGAKLSGVQRGAIPRMLPSSVALAVLVAPFDQGAANDLISAQVSVRERFSYGR